MIKVIASDMDGTLLGSDHRIAPETVEAIRTARDHGIRFMVATGRNFRGAMEALKNVDLTCDYIVGSGAEVRDPNQNIVSTAPISREVCRQLYEELREFPVSIIFNTDHYDYRIGSPEEIEDGFIKEIQYFFSDMNEEEARNSDLYQRLRKSTRVLTDFNQLMEAEVPVYKLFLFSDDVCILDRVKDKFQNNPNVAVASSFPTNQEITAAEAQKGPVLKKYIESLGYTMDQVMVLGDSMNDYSMLSMDFGATVAVENAVPEIKAVARYVTKSNTELGVAYAIERLLEEQYS